MFVLSWLRKPESSVNLSFLQVFFGGDEEKERLSSSVWGNSPIKRYLKIKSISSLGIFCNCLSVFSVSQSFWISASGSYLPVCEGRKEIQITRKNWPKWVFSPEHDVSITHPDLDPLVITSFDATWVQNSTLYLCLFPGGSSHQRAHDEKRQHDGWIPTFGKQSQLFPLGCSVSAGFSERYGFLFRWNWTAWKWHMKKTLCRFAPCPQILPI